MLCFCYLCFQSLRNLRPNPARLIMPLFGLRNHWYRTCIKANNLQNIKEGETTYRRGVVLLFLINIKQHLVLLRTFIWRMRFRTSVMTSDQVYQCRRHTNIVMTHTSTQNDTVPSAMDLVKGVTARVESISTKCWHRYCTIIITPSFLDFTLHGIVFARKIPPASEYKQQIQQRAFS
jgi:hypothetical protein